MQAIQRFGAIASIALVGLGGNGVAQAEGFPRYAGTYLAEIELVQIGEFDCQFLQELGFLDSCTGVGIFSLHAGGTIESNDQSDFDDGFDGVALGRWTRTGFRSSTVTTKTVSLGYDVDGNLESYFVRELELTFDASRTSFSGTGTTKVFDASMDPLDPAAIPDVVITQAINAREVR